MSLPIRFSITIPNTFFITGLGRSGTAFLASILSRSKTHKVIHEGYKEQLYREWFNIFPVNRFLTGVSFPFNRNKGYGEVNSWLRFCLHPTQTGPEAMVEKRAIIFRDPRDVISSVMNRPGKTEQDFSQTVERILGFYNNLLALTRHPTIKYEVFDFEKATTDAKYLQGIVDWTGIGDVKVSKETMKKKVNANKTVWFPKWDQWSSEQKNEFLHVKERLVDNSMDRYRD